MASRVFLHIGLPKTGTSYLQGILWANRQQLAEQGLLLPTVKDRHDHYKAWLDVRRASGPRVDPDRFTGTWRRLVRRIHAWPQDALVTHELFSGATRQQAARMVAALEPAEVHVVMTVRDLVRTVPAAWQQSVKSGRHITFADYTRSIFEGTGESTWFRHVQYPERVLARWRAHVPAERLHVVTVPPPGSDPALLWQRFGEVLGIDPERCTMTGARPNTSLGSTEAELLRRVNAVLVPQLPPRQVPRWVGRELARGLLAHRSGQHRFGLPVDARPWAEERSKRSVEALRGSAYDIRGSLDDLVPTASDPAAHHPDTASDGELLDAATETIADLVLRLRDQHARVSSLQRRAGGRSLRGAARRARRQARRVRRRLVARARRAG